jgi:hypothetical protein
VTSQPIWLVQAAPATFGQATQMRAPLAPSGRQNDAETHWWSLVVIEQSPPTGMDVASGPQVPRQQAPAQAPGWQSLLTHSSPKKQPPPSAIVPVNTGAHAIWACRWIGTNALRAQEVIWS